MQAVASLEEIRRVAPSVFAEGPSPRVSERYKFVSTANVVEAMVDNGFQVVGASQSRSKLENGEMFAKHMVRLRYPELEARAVTKDMGYALHTYGIVPEILLRNGHDRNAPFSLDLGIYRFICTNGLVIGDTFAGVRFRHVKSKAIDDVIEGSFTVIDEFGEVVEQVSKWDAKLLTQAEVTQFATEAAALRWDEPPAGIVPQLIEPVRFDDAKDTVWAVYNRVQEHIVKGGNRYKVQGRRGMRSMRSRGIKGIDRNVDINKGLFDLAVKFAA